MAVYGIIILAVIILKIIFLPDHFTLDNEYAIIGVTITVPSTFISVIQSVFPRYLKNGIVLNTSM